MYLSQISPYYPSGKDGGGEKTRRMKWTEARRCWQSFWMHTVSRNDDPEQSDEERDPGGGVSEGGTQEWCLGGGAGSNPEKDPCHRFRIGGPAGWRAGGSLSSIGGRRNGSISEIPVRG